MRSSYGWLAVLVVSLAACRGGGDLRSSGVASPGTPSAAAIAWPDGGGRPLLSLGAATLAVPDDDLGPGQSPPVFEDADKKRLAFATRAGAFRIVYRVDAELFAGPRVKAPLDFADAPGAEQAFEPMFEQAAARRGRLYEAIKADLGEDLLGRALVRTARFDGPEWDEALAKLPENRVADVRKGLAPLLEKGAETAGIGRAVTVVPLRHPAQVGAMTERARELVERNVEPRAAAVLLRSVASMDAPAAAKTACDVLAKGPTDDVLREAAALALAAVPLPCAPLEKLLGPDFCLPYFRCDAQGPLDGRRTSTQDEPLCAKGALAGEIQKELARPPRDVMAAASGTRTGLFAYAALVDKDALPAAFKAAHARRRYAVTQVKAPECDITVALGSPCHCGEAILRDQACRQSQATQVSVGLCKFAVDDKAKKIGDVVMTAPP